MAVARAREWTELPRSSGGRADGGTRSQEQGGRPSVNVRGDGRVSAHTDSALAALAG